ncbi:MAG: DUF4352 domain-containing protein [Sodalinema sp.]|uniref:DUF4352 domain-containing protein n=1 Tax=Sodalinema sp. TaxID=3080550 RepID=UPI001229A4B3|nr:MAG: DUF4352 domain-containing protein [Phormidium sp. SL48-SHIP]
MKLLLSVIILFLTLTSHLIAFAGEPDLFTTLSQNLLGNYTEIDFSELEGEANSCGFLGSESKFFVNVKEAENLPEQVDLLCVASDEVISQFPSKGVLESSDLYEILFKTQALGDLLDEVDSEILQFKEFANISGPYIWLGGKIEDGDFEDFGGIDISVIQKDEKVVLVYLAYINKKNPDVDMNQIISAIAGQGETSQPLAYNSRNYNVRVNSIEYPAEYNQFYEPEDNHVYLSLDVSMKNKSSELQSVGLMSFKLKDGQGFVYEPEWTKIKGPKFPVFERLSSQEQTRGWITFEIPQSSQDLVLEYSDFDENFKIQLSSN